jgi:hypothetical protein
MSEVRGLPLAIGHVSVAAIQDGPADVSATGVRGGVSKVTLRGFQHASLAAARHTAGRSRRRVRGEQGAQWRASSF